MTTRKCPLCKKLVEYRLSSDISESDGVMRWYECPSCGTVEITDYAENWLSLAKPHDLQRLVEQASSLPPDKYLSIKKGQRIQNIETKEWGIEISEKQRG